jgi:hypothetical protein
MKLGQLGLQPPRIGGRQFASPSDLGGTAPGPSLNAGKSLAGPSMISSAATGGGAPPIKNLGAKIISALRARRRGLGAPLTRGRRM